MNNQYSYFLVYKPYGMITPIKPTGKNTKQKSLHKFPLDCYPIDRLETDSEGLLLLTNDKKINHKLLDAKMHFKKTYLVQVDGEISDEAIKKLCDGLEIKLEGKNYTTLPAKAEKIEPPSLPPRIPPVRFRKTVPTSWLKIELTEIKNRQVKTMTAAVGFPTLRLVRCGMEKIEVGNMLPNDVVEMTNEEVYKKLF